MPHIPDDAAVVPGTDVHGRPVAPADVDGLPVELPRYVRVFLDVPLRALHSAEPRRLGSAEVALGVVDVDLATGQASYNGQPLNPSASVGWIAGCEAVHGGRSGPG